MLKNKIFTIFAIIIIILSCYKIFGILNEYRVSENLYSSLAKDFIKTDGNDIGYNENNDDNQNDKNSGKKTYLSKKIDFEGLVEINPEIIGWISFDDDSISYPIMLSTDNSKYLNMAFDGTISRSGAIFMDFMNNGSFEESHTILYGHNMKDGSMFGKLKKLKSDEEYLINNKCFTIYTPDKEMRYEIFAVYNVEATDDKVYVVNMSSDELEDFIDSCIRRSTIEFENKPSIDDEILTLSTCQGEQTRLVVNAFKIDE